MKDLSVKISIAALALLFFPAFAMAQTPQLDPGEKLEKLQFPAVTMQLKGWTKFGNGHVYTLPVRAGQHVKIDFSTRSKFAFLAIFDLSKPDDEAFFGTDEDGMSFQTTVKENTTWLLRPYYSKVSPRRGLGAPFSILIEPLAAAPQQPPAEPDSPSLFPKAPPKAK
ncbi:hypothetical conserved protein [Rhizobium etli CFN 42]|uniref:Uncharacterized protein n=2 Tax=Rhizobium etli TaxID=29449 RepID=A0AAN1BDJ6_RHIET|nr:hypothetical protein [Rhizobium etli]ABC89627.1 hypothetical conserved protein [Rhizobium etli CFN 42]AGS20674.1 hypothetical protein REMIM1_CH00826 [Rhizobium etli bv. mimosae str. Mim1]ARQ08917.1 hypothetical protein NXC12_CH00837 [Rhizobium etli]